MSLNYRILPYNSRKNVDDTNPDDRRTSQKTVLPPDHQLIDPVLAERDLGTIQGSVETFPSVERKTQLLVSRALAQISKMKNHVQINNLTSPTNTVNSNTSVVTLRILTPNQAKILQLVSNEQLTLTTKYPEETTNDLNRLFQEPVAQSSRRWYPTPEACDDPSTLNRVKRRIYDEILKLCEEEKLDPTVDDQHRQAFLANFQWDGSILAGHERQQIGNLLVKYHNIFARHRLDISINIVFKIKLTPKHDDPMYAKSLPTPMNLQDDLLVELALMQEYGIITTLPYSKYSLSTFAQRKSNG